MEGDESNKEDDKDKENNKEKEKSKDPIVYSNRPEESFKHNFNLEPHSKSKEESKSSSKSTKKDADAEIDDSISPGDNGETPKSEVQNKDEVRAKDSPNTDTPNDQINKVLAAQEQEVDHETESYSQDDVYKLDEEWLDD